MANEADLMRKLEKLSVDSAASALHVLHRLGGSDRAPRPRDGKEKVDPLRALVFDVAHYLLDGYEHWLKVQERYFDYVADSARELASPCRPADGGALELEGKLGGMARGRFQIENDRGADLELSFRFGEFSAAGGDRRFAAAVTVGPPGVDAPSAADRLVAAGERRAFEVAVRLDGGMFEAKHRYLGEIQVVAAGRTLGELAIEVSVKEEGP